MIGKDISTPKGEGEKNEFVTDWFDRLSRGIKRRRKEEARWEANEDYEDMKQWGGEAGGYDEVTVNKLGAYIRNFVSQVAFNNPRCKMTPQTADGWEAIQVPIAGAGGQPQTNEMGQVVTREVVPAKVREALVNETLDAPMQNLQMTSTLVTKAGVIGYGVLKSIYEPVFSTAPEPESDQVIPLVDGKMDLSQFARNKIDGNLVDNGKDRLVTRASIPIWEDFTIKWVPYRNMIIDPDGGNYWDQHNWVCEEEIRTLEQVKADPLFKNTDELSPSGRRVDDKESATEYETTGSDWSKTDDKDMDEGDVVRLFHIYDMINEEYIVLADGHAKELRKAPWTELKIVDHPYSDFRPNQIMGEFYPRPPATDLVPINEWYNLSRQQELRAMKASSPKVLARKGIMTPDNLELLTNDDYLAWAELDVPKGVPIGDYFQVFTPPSLGADTWRNSSMIAADFAEVGGQTDEARGKASADTATQVNAMEQYSGNRTGHDRKVLAETWRRAFKKLNDCFDANMTKERAVMVQGSDGEAFQALIDLDMVAGDFDTSVDFQEMAESDTAMQASGRTQIAQIAGQAPHLFSSEPLVKGWLEPYGIKDQNFIDALVEASQMQMQMLMQQAQPDGPVPEAGAAGNEADAISQQAAGGQARNMQGAS